LGVCPFLSGLVSVDAGGGVRVGGAPGAAAAAPLAALGAPPAGLGAALSPAGPAERPAGPASPEALARAFARMHGVGGWFPLLGPGEAERGPGEASVLAAAAAAYGGEDAPPAFPALPAAGVPVASIGHAASLWSLWQRAWGRKGRQGRARRPRGARRRPGGGGGPASRGGGRGSAQARGAQASGASQGGPPPDAPRCPLRKFPGIAPLVALYAGETQLICPPAVVQMRAALARTTAMKLLRPQALGYKAAAAVGISALVNLPFGVAREHTSKFSWQWAVCVHASIPFLAMFRKAAIMPRYAILFTVAGALVGQGAGARMERRRLEERAAQRLREEAEREAALAEGGRSALFRGLAGALAA